MRPFPIAASLGTALALLGCGHEEPSAPPPASTPVEAPPTEPAPPPAEPENAARGEVARPGGLHLARIRIAPQGGGDGARSTDVTPPSPFPSEPHVVSDLAIDDGAWRCDVTIRGAEGRATGAAGTCAREGGPTIPFDSDCVMARTTTVAVLAGEGVAYAVSMVCEE